MRLSGNEIKNIEMFKRWGNIKNRIPQKFEGIGVGEIKDNETNKGLYEYYDRIDFTLENDAQHCDHYFYTVTGRYSDSDDWETLFIIDDNVKYDDEWAKRLKQHSELCYKELIKYDIEWDMEMLEQFEDLYGDNYE